ncbi:DUF6249 domain-containing protein [Parabacteroides sp. Marseille-P3160]|uniref:DUF6249 domain-containing protein n=1 Tax=Parabacteroides sp. Marseille-P3160 TaxID=1917887 RepID=UPI0009BABBFB|nr:DUF6249 domain-containing protein [Parabacteroides sp. Marseille-P3160]
MMDFIMVPLILGITCAAIYGIFELFVRRKERMAIIEKLGDKIKSADLNGKIELPSFGRKFSFGALKAGCLLAGIGLGLLVGFIISTSIISSYQNDGWYRGELMSTAYGASVLLFGGIGLLIAFVIEIKMGKKGEK